jgi:hypothetical protein
VGVLTTALATAALPKQPAATLLLTKGAGPSAPGGPAAVSKPHAVTAKASGHKQAKTLTHPALMHLTKAGSAVFDVRKLKSVVVKQERPEAGEIPGVESSLPPTVNPKQLPALPSASPAPAPDSQFDGLDFATWGAGHPPDTNGDVGPTYYIQTINTSIGIYDKSNGNRVAAFTFNSFMSQGSFGNLCDTNNFGDPVVLYDTYEDRWFITDFAFKLDGSGNVSPQHVFQCFAVSKTGDPVNGGWNFYSIEDPGGLADYPKFGVWPDGIYMSANMFPYASGGSYFGYHVWALDKQQMYAGAPSPEIVDFAGDTSDFTVIPANSRLQDGTPPSGSPEYFVSTEQFLNGLSIYKFHVDWDKVSTSTFTGPDIQLAPNCWPNASPTSAATTANAADVLAIRAMAQAQYTNQAGAESLWVDHTVQRGVSLTNTTCNAPTGGFATVRWYQANVTGGTVAANTVQGATFDPEGANTFYRYVPSLAVDRVGDMAVDYTKSNSTTPPGIKYAGRLAGDPANTLAQGEQTLIDGTGSQTGNCGSSTCIRWGDYSGMALDPNGCEFWTTALYYLTNGLNFNTRIGSFHYPGCTTIGTGTLAGTVTTGATAVAGATVALGNRTTTTDAGGHYAFIVPAGTYPTLSASKAGFDTASTSTISVPNGASATRDFSLTAAAQSGCFTDDTQDQFQRGVPSNCNLVASPGSVILASPENNDASNTNVSPAGFGFDNANWAGQTFMPTVTGQLRRIDVELFCAGCTAAGPNVTLSIRATTGSPAVPTGGDLATATLAGFNDQGAGGLKTFTFGSPMTVTAGTTYALIFRASATFANGTYAYTCSCATTGFSNTNPYTAGQRVTSANSGSSWTADTTAGGRDLDFVTYVDPGFASSGTFVSSVKDANPAAGMTAFWTTLSWTATTPAGTAVKFQVAGSNSQYGPFNFVGPDGTPATFFTTSGASLSQFLGLRYLRYKAFLSTSNSAVSPSLSSVEVCFIDAAATGVTAVAATGPFGGTTDLSATLTDTGVGVVGATINFALNGTGVGSAITDANGVAVLTGASLAGINVGTYPNGVTASFAGGGGHAASSDSEPLTVSKADQAISVTTHAPATASFGSGFSVAATAPGGAVSFSSAGSCSNSGATFTMTSGSGTCSVKYDQSGSANYNAATEVVESVTAQKASQTISVTTHAPGSAAFGASFGVAATAPGGPVSFSSGGSCSNSGATFTMTSGNGTCSVMYDQAGNANYNAATQIVESATAQKASQSITVTMHAPASAANGASFSVAASAPGGAVTFSSAGSCTNSGAAFTMTSSTGTCSVKYDQAGSTNYNAAPQVVESVAASTQNFTLRVTKSGTGTGTVTSSPSGISCGAKCSASFAQRTTVTLNRTAGSGSTFAGWSGACSGTGSCTVTMSAAKTVTATFKKKAPPKCIVPNVKGKPLATAKRKITAANCSTGSVTQSRSKTVPKGDVVSQSPKPATKLANGGKVDLVVSRGKR